MNALAILIYLLKTAVIMAVFYMFYRLLLSKETFHRVNRIVLLATAAMSFILPFCIITIEKVVEVPISKAVTQTETATDTVSKIAEKSSLWPEIILGIVAMGAIFVLFKTFRSIHKVLSLIRHSRKEIGKDGTEIYVTSEPVSPFSWMSYIVISENDFLSSENCMATSADGLSESALDEIILHEKAHIALKHSYDILFTDILTAFQWFNPAMWMLRSDLRAIHEYQADDRVLKSGINAGQYQLLLIKKAVGNNFYSVANSFNHNVLKNRITMMLSKKSSSAALWKVLFIIPVIGITLMTSAKTKTTYKDAEASYNKEAEAGIASADSVIYYVNDVKVTKGIVDALNHNMISNINVDKSNGRKEVRINLKPEVKVTQNVEVISYGDKSDKIDASEIETIIINKSDKVKMSESKSVSIKTSSDGSDDNATITINVTKDGKDLLKGDFRSVTIKATEGSDNENVQIFVDGKKITDKEMQAMDPDSISSINVNKKEKESIVEITTKK